MGKEAYFAVAIRLSLAEWLEMIDKMFLLALQKLHIKPSKPELEVSNPSFWKTHMYMITEVTAAAAAAKSLQSCPTLCDPMNCSTLGLPVHHQLLEFTQTHAVILEPRKIKSTTVSTVSPSICHEVMGLLASPHASAS